AESGEPPRSGKDGALPCFPGLAVERGAVGLDIHCVEGQGCGSVPAQRGPALLRRTRLQDHLGECVGGDVMTLAGILLAASLTLTRPAPELTDSTLVGRAPAVAGPFARIAVTAPGATAYVDSTVTAGTTYFYRIAAVNEEGISPYSNVASGTAPAPRPS